MTAAPATPDDPFRIGSEDELRALFEPTRDYVRSRQLDGFERHSRRFIANSPFVLVASSHPGRGTDVSPRGDAPGFVAVLDDRTLAIPDRPGNNRLDTMSNILANPEVGLLFLIPGIDEMLRVNGTAALTRDPGLLAATAVNGREPKVVVRVSAREVFLHCGKAVKRSRIWDPERHLDRSTIPSLAQMTADQIGRPDRLAEIGASVEQNYRERLY